MSYDRTTHVKAMCFTKSAGKSAQMAARETKTPFISSRTWQTVE